MMNKVNLRLGLLFVFLLFGVVYLNIPYQLYQLEHTHLFQEDWDWFLPFLDRMGGWAEWMGAYAIQFFAWPVAGSWVFVLPVYLSGVVMALLMRQKVKSFAVWMPLSLWVSVLQLASLFDSNFHWAGSVALLLALACLLSVSYVPVSSLRRGLFIVGIPLVAWLLGSVVLVYVLLGILLFASLRHWASTMLLPLLVYGATVSFFCYQGWCPSWRVAFSPEMYYEPLLAFPLRHWLVWGSVVLTGGICRFLPMLDDRKKVVCWTLNLLGWVLPCGFLLNYVPQLRHSSNLDLWRLNHYVYTEDWDAVLDFLSGRPMDNYLFMNYANMALAEKGQLGNQAFRFRPRGVNALQVKANSTGYIRMLASDVNYTVGCIAEAQQHAFEAQTTFPNSLGIQTLKRLIKTNLIFGHYEVAEKYLALVAKTTFHKEWAEKYRAFLYDDGAVEKDAELGEKRRNLSERNRFCMFDGWQPELEDLAEANPDNAKALEYLGLYHLLGKDLEGFAGFLDKYYKDKEWETWPDAFQQGQILLLHQAGEVWEDKGLSPRIVNEYNQYLSLFARNRQQPNVKNVMSRSFGHTFWYYFMFV